MLLYILTHKNNEIQVRHLYAAADHSIGFFLKKTSCIKFRMFFFFQANPADANHFDAHQISLTLKKSDNSIRELENLKENKTK